MVLGSSHKMLAGVLFNMHICPGFLYLCELHDQDFEIAKDWAMFTQKLRRGAYVIQARSD